MIFRRKHWMKQLTSPSGGFTTQMTSLYSDTIHQRNWKVLGPPDYCPLKHSFHYGNVHIWTHMALCPRFTGDLIALWDTKFNKHPPIRACFHVISLSWHFCMLLTLPALHPIRNPAQLHATSLHTTS